MLYTKDITHLQVCPTAYSGTTVDIPTTVISIGTLAFYVCPNITSIVIPNSVTTLGRQPFFSCKKLEEVTIGSSVAEMDYGAFSYCSSIKKVYCLPQTLPTITISPAETFANQVYKNATLYVPNGCKEMYEAAEPWSLFANIVEETGTGIGGISTEKVSIAANNGSIVINGLGGRNIVEVYTLNGTQVYRGTNNVVNGLSKGVYIVKVGKTTKKVAL